MPFSSFYEYFVHVLRYSKQVFQTEIKPKKVLKLRHFFSRPSSKVTNFNTSPMLPHPFEKFLLDTLNSEQKPSVKNRSTGSVRNRSTGSVRNRSTGRSTGDDFEIYRSGGVEKILTGSISAQDASDEMSDMNKREHSDKLFDF